MICNRDKENNKLPDNTFFAHDILMLQHMLDEKKIERFTKVIENVMNRLLIN